jgi:hypothetical protein
MKLYTRKPDDVITHIGWYIDDKGNELLDVGPKLLCSDGMIVKMRRD